MRTRAILMTGVLGLTLALGVGCDRFTRNDAQIASDIQSKINSDATVQNKQVTISSDRGVVTLSGTVNSDMERTAAANDAGQVSGVKTVVNNLQVASAAMQPMDTGGSNFSRNADNQAQSAYRSNRHSTGSTSAHNFTDTSTRSNVGSSTGSSTTTANNAVSAPIAPPKPITVTIAEGTAIPVTLIDSLSSETNKVGDTFRASLMSPLVDQNGQTAIPANADVEGRVVSVQPSTHFSGHSALVLELGRLTAGGKTYEISTNQWQKQGANRGKRSAITIGGGAGLGAIIGGLAGGGKGAAIGAGAGAAAGTGVQGLTHGEAVRLPSETRLDFRLQSPITVTQTNSTQRPIVQ